VSLQEQVSGGSSVNFAGCLYRAVLGECVGGYQNVTTIGEPAGSNSLVSCTNLKGDYLVLCGRTGVRLPFFGMTQFVVALIIIILVYLLVKSGFFNKRKSKHKKR
jgi:hypothetical protein